MLEKIKILKDNEIYRVFDLFNKPLKDKIVVELLNNDIYKDTIMRRYFECFGETKNYSLLYSVVKEYVDKNNITNDGRVYVYLRTGDEYKIRGLGNVENFKFYIDEINKYDLSKTIVLATSMHYGHHRTSNKFYKKKKGIYTDESRDVNLKLIQSLIEEISHNVEIHSTQNPDIDLSTLSIAKNLIITPNSGGFAKVIIELNKIHNESV